MLTVSIVIYDSPAEQVKTAVECIRRALVDKIWIVYNGDLMKSTEYEIDGTELILTENRGYGAGHNKAIQRAIDAGADFHLVMNSDVIWKGDIISKLIEKLEADARIGLIGPAVKNQDGSLQYSCRMLPTPWGLLTRRFLPSFLCRKANDKYLLKHVDHSRPINAPYLLGSFMLFRIEALKSEGFFDERFFLYPEDIDITRRIHRNWKTLYEPETEIFHAHDRRSYRSIKMLWIHLVNMAKYFNKWGWIRDKERREFNGALT